jgi:hypothetical protein
MKVDCADFEKEKSKFVLLVDVLTKGNIKSNGILPPINWYYIINNLIKSKYGNYVESRLIELLILQINSSNTAYSLMKNYLLDSNYFLEFNVC